MSSSSRPSFRLRPTLALLTLLLVGGLLFLYRGCADPVDERFVTVRSGGGSLGGRDRIIVRGDAVSSGDRLEVLNRPLVVALSDTSVVLRFESGSRWRYRGRYSDSRRPEVSVRSGAGRARARARPVRLVFPAVTLHLRGGLVQWTLDGNRLTVRATPRTLAYVKQSDTEIPLSRSDVYGGGVEVPRQDPVKSSGMPRNFSGGPAQSSSLLSGGRLRRRIEETARRTGKYPETLVELFGHWVRDRWGNVYYYNPDGDGFTVVSGGPDGRLFTDDDRRWTD